MGDFPIIIVLLVAVAILLRLDFIYYLVYLLAGLYALSFWWTGRNLSRLRVRRLFTDHIFLGETIAIGLEIHNASWWPVPWLRCEEMAPGNLSSGHGLRHIIALRPKERTLLSYEVMGRTRGYYELGPTVLSTGDLFGFTETRGRAEKSDHLTVYPKVIALSQVGLTSRAPYGTIKSQERIFADPARVSGKREYVPGDPLKSIDWKSSAHAATLQVKKLEPAVSLTSMVFLDLHSDAFTRNLLYSASEWGIVVAASLANYLVSQRQSVGLACNGLDPLSARKCWSIAPRLGRTHLMKLLEWLARVQLAETTPLADWLPTATLGLAWGTTILAVTPTGDEAVCRSLHRLLRAGLNPVMLVIEPYAHFDVVRERARQLGIVSHRLADERDLQRWDIGALRVPWHGGMS